MMVSQEASFSTSGSHLKQIHLYSLSAKLLATHRNTPKEVQEWPGSVSLGWPLLGNVGDANG
jgi:hypothetical protein